MAAGAHDDMAALLNGLAEVIEGIANVQGVPGEEDVDEAVMFDGSELPLIDGDTVVVGMTNLTFTLRSGRKVLLDVIPS